MTKAVLAGEQVKELAHKYRFAILTAPDAEFTWFTKDFLVRNCPRDTGNGDCQNKQPGKL